MCNVHSRKIINNKSGNVYTIEYIILLYAVLCRMTMTFRSHYYGWKIVSDFTCIFGLGKSRNQKQILLVVNYSYIYRNYSVF